MLFVVETTKEKESNRHGHGASYRRQQQEQEAAGSLGQQTWQQTHNLTHKEEQQTL